MSSLSHRGLLIDLKLNSLLVSKAAQKVTKLIRFAQWLICYGMVNMDIDKSCHEILEHTHVKSDAEIRTLFLHGFDGKRVHNSYT